jgi:hypothetical protein
MPHQRMAWLIKLGCSLAPGGGLRGMHFIAMPALDLCATVRYDPWITLAPMLPSQLAALATTPLIRRPSLTPRERLARRHARRARHREDDEPDRRTDVRLVRGHNTMRESDFGLLLGARRE